MKSRIILLAAVCLVSAAQSVSAYIDPATGSIIFQLLIAGFVGIVYFSKKNILALKERLLSRGKKKNPD